MTIRNEIGVRHHLIQDDLIANIANQSARRRRIIWNFGNLLAPTDRREHQKQNEQPPHHTPPHQPPIDRSRTIGEKEVFVKIPTIKPIALTIGFMILFYPRAASNLSRIC